VGRFLQTQTSYRAATYTKVGVSGVSCKLADKEFSAVTLPGDHPSIVVTVQTIKFVETVQYLPTGFDLYLKGEAPKYAHDSVSAVVTQK
jgi:hypothetical protein